MTIIIAIIGFIVVSLVAYAVFILPHRTDWEAVSRSLEIYDTPQSFTEIGLEAEWGTPRTPEIPTLPNFARPGENNVVYATPIDTPVLGQPRRRKSRTLVGVVPARNSHIMGIQRLNRSELAKLVRENLCVPECTIFVQQDNFWQCQCGAVTKHANTSSGIASRISV